MYVFIDLVSYQYVYYIHFEIVRNPCILIDSQQCGLKFCLSAPKLCYFKVDMTFQCNK